MQLLFATVARSADTLDIWQWRNPLPAGNFKLKVAYVGNQFVVLPTGISRGLLTSPDGLNWVSRPFPFDAFLKDVTYGDGRYVVVGSAPDGPFFGRGSGFIASSTDLSTWTRHESGTTNPLWSVTYGAGQFVTVGEPAYVANSITGTNWTAQNSGGTQSGVYIEEIEYGNGRFVVSTRGQTVLTSDDGTNWVSNVVSNGVGIWSISYAGGKFYAAGLRGVQFTYFPVLRTSTDGLTWTAGSDPRPSGQSAFHVVAGDGMLLGVLESFSSLASAADGVTFTNLQTIGYGPSRSVAYGAGLFVNDALQTSVDAVNWSQSAVQPTNSAAFLDLFFQTNQYVAIGRPYFVSSNGLEFWPTTNALPDPITRVRQANGLFVGVGSAGAIYRSTNGWNWELRNSATTLGLTDAAYGNGLWVAVGGGGTITVSASANAWSLRTSGTALTLNGVVYAGGQFVAVGQSGTVLTSADGSTWLPQYAGTLETLNQIAFGNGKFAAVGANGTILTSTDAVDWTGHSNVTTNGLSDITFGEGVFCAVGNTGTPSGIDGTAPAVTSADGVNWTSRRLLFTSVQGLSRVRFLNGTFFALAGRNIIQSGPVTPVQLEARWNAGTPQISIHATPNLLLRLEASAQLLSAQWDDLGLLQVPASGALSFEDTPAVGHATRFYRAVAP